MKTQVRGVLPLAGLLSALLLPVPSAWAGTCPPIDAAVETFPARAQVVMNVFTPLGPPIVVRAASTGLTDAITSRGLQGVDDVIDFDLDDIELRGNHPQLGGEFFIRQAPAGFPSDGGIVNIEREFLTCELIAGNAFLDVWLEIEAPGLGETWEFNLPVRISNQIDHLPLNGLLLESPVKDNITVREKVSNIGRAQLVYLGIEFDPVLPEAGPDCFDSSLNFRLTSPTLGLANELLTADGPATVQRADPMATHKTCSISGSPCVDDMECPVDETCEGPLDHIDTELVEMTLTSPAPHPILGDYTVLVQGTPASVGQITSVTSGTAFPADSVFDVFFRLETSQGNFENTTKSRLSTEIGNIPPDLDTTFSSAGGTITDVYEEGGGAFVGEIQDINHVLGLPSDWNPPQPSGEDCFEVMLQANIVVNGSPTNCEEELFISGRMRLLRDNPFTLGTGMDLVDAVIAKSELVNTSACFLNQNITIRTSTTLNSSGDIDSLAAEEFFPANASFNLQLELVTPSGEVYRAGPAVSTTTIHSIPPDHGEIFFSNGAVLSLRNSLNQVVGTIQELARVIGDPIECQPEDYARILQENEAGGGVNKSRFRVRVPNGGTGMTYDVVRGTLNNLRSTGTFNVICAQSNGGETFFDFSVPSAGDAYFYLTREYYRGFRGTWNAVGGNQVADRDPQITVCP